MNKLDLIIYHGWALSPAYYNDWLQLKTDIVNVKFFNRRYFINNQDKTEDFANFSPQIIIAHSLGLHLAPAALLANCKLLVVIAGFDQFYSHDLTVRNKESKIIQRMKNKLINQPIDLLCEFYNNCGLIYDQGFDPDYNLLIQDLDYLVTCKLDLTKINFGGKVLIMHGNDDKIINVDKANDLRDYFKKYNQALSVKTIFFDNTGHDLPTARTQECLENILDFYYKD